MTITRPSCDTKASQGWIVICGVRKRQCVCLASSSPSLLRPLEIWHTHTRTHARAHVVHSILMAFFVLTLDMDELPCSKSKQTQGLKWLFKGERKIPWKALGDMTLSGYWASESVCVCVFIENEERHQYQPSTQSNCWLFLIYGQQRMSDPKALLLWLWRVNISFWMHALFFYKATTNFSKNATHPKCKTHNADLFKLLKDGIFFFQLFITRLLLLFTLYI